MLRDGLENTSALSAFAATTEDQTTVAKSFLPHQTGSPSLLLRGELPSTESGRFRYLAEKRYVVVVW